MEDYITDVATDLIDDMLKNDTAFKNQLIWVLKDKLMDSFKSLNLKDTLQEEINDMIYDLIHEDDELLDATREKLSELIDNLIEVKVKDVR